MKRTHYFKVIIIYAVLLLNLTGCEKEYAYVSPNGIEYQYKLTLYENVYKDVYEYEVLTNNKNLTVKQIRDDLLSSQLLSEEEMGYYLLSTRVYQTTEEPAQ